MKIHPGHFVAVVGGAVAGAEAAAQLTSRGIYVAVFEQNPLPYGKIEDGLPKWHVKLRDKEEQKIDEKIKNPYVFYVPNAKLGQDIAFEDLINNWGFSAVLLATGAWRDRPLPVRDIEKYLNRGFYFQNPFVVVVGAICYIISIFLKKEKQHVNSTNQRFRAKNQKKKN